MNEYLLSALATLLVITDPLFNSAIFMGLTKGLTPAQSREVALRGCSIAFCILLAAGLGGAQLLPMLGISLPAFRIAGGLLLLLSAAEMVMARRFGPHAEEDVRSVTPDQIRHIASFPLAIPLLAGPGAITAMILLAGRANGDLLMLGGLYAVVALTLLVCLACFLTARRISVLLGVTGRIVVSRLLGIILAALAVQFIIDGIKALV
jgi:multiple antibiotic resistance protein